MVRGFLGLMAVGDEACHQIDNEVDGAAVAGLFDLGDVLEVVEDRLDDRPFAQEQPVDRINRYGPHGARAPGVQSHALLLYELASQGPRHVALLPNEEAKQAGRLAQQMGNGPRIVDIARSERIGEQVALVVDDRMQLEPIKPAQGLPSCGHVSKDLVLVNAGGMTDRERRRIDEADAGTGAALGRDVHREGHDHPPQNIHEAGVDTTVRKLLP